MMNPEQDLQNQINILTIQMETMREHIEVVATFVEKLEKRGSLLSQLEELKKEATES